MARPAEDITFDLVVSGFIKLRDEKKKIEQRHKEELAPIKEHMAKLESWCQRELHRMDAKSCKTEHGTVFTQEVSSVTVKDWESTLPFIIENGLTDMLVQRVNMSAVRDFIESFKKVPPGVDIQTAEVVRFRR